MKALRPWLPLLLLLPACGGPELDDAEDEVTAQALPPSPRIQRDLALTSEAAGVQVVNRAVLPPLTTTADGRIGVSREDGSNLYLFSPEKLGQHLWETSGPETLSSVRKYALNAGRRLVSDDPTTTLASNHSVICDPTRPFGADQAAASTPTPQACAADPTRDCYSFVVITGSVDTLGRARLHSRRVSLEVTAPKTAAAAIDYRTITVGPLVSSGFLTLRGKPSQIAGSVFEPTITNDGHLLVLRVGNSITDLEKLDIVYAMHPNPASDAPCDITKWTELSAVSRANSDARVAHYGFARYPLRDGLGAAITPGMDLHASYPWIDREGRNLFFLGVETRLFGKVTKDPAEPLCPGGGQNDVHPGTYSWARVPVRCADGGTTSCKLDHNACEQPGLQGFAVAGLWTHGKIVLVDNRLSHTDFGLQLQDGQTNYRRRLRLYESGGPFGTGEVLVGGGRQRQGSFPQAVGGNTSLIESLENRFIYDDHLRPRSPRDVVWVMSKGLASDEVVFDDFLSPHAIIVADMIPAWQHTDPRAGAQGRRRYFDGWSGLDRTTPAGAAGELRFQNAATAPPRIRAVPAHGTLVGEGRAEPVGQGGIVGRGLWTRPTTRLRFDIPPQPATDTAYFIGVFVDMRDGDGSVVRSLLQFPDGSRLVAVGQHELRYLGAEGGLVRSIPLPAQHRLGGGWHHLGLHVGFGGGTVHLFIDGFKVDFVTQLASPVFRLISGGRFLLNAAERGGTVFPGLNAWWDELRIVMLPLKNVQQELACNYAHGTLVALTAASPAGLRAFAEDYPTTFHDDLGRILRAKGEGASVSPIGRYACVHDYSSEFAPELARPGTIPLRSALLFPEGPLHAASPRPDSSANAFCLTCHTDRHLPEAPTLGPAAIELRADLTVVSDRRRQPLQPFRLLFGNVPDGFLGSPAQLPAAPGGRLIDPLVAP